MLYYEFPEEYFYPVVAKDDLVETMTRSAVIEPIIEEDSIVSQEIEETTVAESTIEDNINVTEEVRIQEDSKEEILQEEVLKEIDEEYANIEIEEEEI